MTSLFWLIIYASFGLSNQWIAQQPTTPQLHNNHTMIMRMK